MPIPVSEGATALVVPRRHVAKPLQLHQPEVKRLGELLKLRRGKLAERPRTARISGAGTWGLKLSVMGWCEDVFQMHNYIGLSDFAGEFG